MRQVSFIAFTVSDVVMFVSGVVSTRHRHDVPGLDPDGVDRVERLRAPRVAYVHHSAASGLRLVERNQEIFQNSHNHER